jgi:hypothetical protein
MPPVAAWDGWARGGPTSLRFFDVVASNVPDGKQIGGISLFWTAGRQIYRGPSFIDDAEALNLRTQSTKRFVEV